MALQFGIRLEPSSNIKIKMNRVMLDRILNKFDRKIVSRAFKTAFEGAIVTSPAWTNMLANADEGLVADFGLRRGSITSSLDTILGTWLDSIKIKTRKKLTRQRFSLEIKVTGVRYDFADVISLSEAITKNSSTTDGSELPWLKWLLLEGDRTIIQDYHVQYSNTNKSRSGKGIMELGGSFSVNPTFSGVAGNNFVTDAIKTMDQSLIIDSIKKGVINAL